MILKLTDYADGKPVLVNMRNIIRVQEYSDRAGRMEKAAVGSRLLSVCSHYRGTSFTDPFPVDVRETVAQIEQMVEGQQRISRT